MRILVTGVSGQVGSALIPALVDLGTVVSIDRATMDLTAIGSISTTLSDVRPDLIINPAAYTAVDQAEDERDLAYLVNSEAPEAIADWAAPRNVPLIHFSTDYVFNGVGSRPWREDDTTGPLSVYGASKLAGERAIRAKGGPHLIVRTSWVYSARGKNFLRTIARLACERKELRVVSDQIGAPTSAAVIATAMARLLEITRGDLSGGFSRAAGVIHLAAGGEASWHDFALAIWAGLREREVPVAVDAIVPISTADFPTKARRPGNSRLDMTRLASVFGLVTPAWNFALQSELDLLADELR